MLPVVLADSGTAEKIFVLDTNVLMHDPSALFRFQEHHAYLPMTALEELDNAKLGVSEVARNVRHVEHSGIHTPHIRSRPSPIDALVICNIFSFIWRAKIA